MGRASLVAFCSRHWVLFKGLSACCCYVLRPAPGMVGVVRGRPVLSVPWFGSHAELVARGQDSWNRNRPACSRSQAYSAVRAKSAGSVPDGAPSMFLKSMAALLATGGSPAHSSEGLGYGGC